MFGKTIKLRKNSYIENLDLITDAYDISSELLERDRQQAMKDILVKNAFQPAKDRHGPYTLELYTEDNRLIFHITNNKGKDLNYLVLSLKPYRRIIKDYFLIVRSYDDAVKDGKPSRIEAIDMGRRGLHNEGATLLLERLSDKIMLDMDTARRLFTLICVLHSGKTHIMR
tara:strand:- start:604 stop:1113 length:510 start_codon:yes stop_codon:yes gene_type:complete